MGAWQWPPLTNYDFCYYTYNCLTFLWLHFSRERQDKPSRQKNAQTDRQTGIDRETKTEAVDFSLWRPWQRGQTDRKADRQVGRQTGRLAGRQEEREQTAKAHKDIFKATSDTENNLHKAHNNIYIISYTLIFPITRQILALSASLLSEPPEAPSFPCSARSGVPDPWPPLLPLATPFSR